jgi:hypothetical protein
MCCRTSYRYRDSSYLVNANLNLVNVYQFIANIKAQEQNQNLVYRSKSEVTNYSIINPGEINRR